MGRLVRNTISRGYLCGERALLTWARRSSASASPAASRCAGDHVGAREDEPVALDARHRALADRVVRQQALLDLGRRDPDAADLQQLVGAARYVK